jgi:hypothetical protein
MKTPRIADFDPDAKVPRLKSSLDNMPVIEKSTQSPLPIQSIKENIKLKHVPPYGSTPRTPSSSEAPRRKIKQRHPFDIYQDQLDSLREISIREKMRGGIGSMSAMVREALDFYLKNKIG